MLLKSLEERLPKTDKNKKLFEEHRLSREYVSKNIDKIIVLGAFEPGYTLRLFLNLPSIDKFEVTEDLSPEVISHFESVEKTRKRLLKYCIVTEIIKATMYAGLGYVLYKTFFGE